MTHAHDDKRLAAAKNWLNQLSGFHFDLHSMCPASNDASFRRYFRVQEKDRGSFILMDAPAPQEDVRPFVKVAELFAKTGMHVPQIVAQEPELGFLLLSDFGNITYLDKLNAQSATQLYREASSALVLLQSASRAGVLPEYDEALLARELALFPDWYLARHKGVTLDPRQRAVLDNGFKLIIENNLAQPKVFVHRDYHSRNLMLPPTGATPGVIDFQDAVYGPITYDLVSLLRDAYITWTEQQVIDWAIHYWELARKAKLPVSADFSEFYRDFEWMGLQRHLKVLGIFARLCYRDGKDRYLADMPVVLAYTLKAARRYRALEPMAQLIETIEEQTPTSGYTF
jgi:N-acetylmuramate 1-kinase